MFTRNTVDVLNNKKQKTQNTVNINLRYDLEQNVGHVLCASWQSDPNKSTIGTARNTRNKKLHALNVADFEVFYCFYYFLFRLLVIRSTMKKQNLLIYSKHYNL